MADNKRKQPPTGGSGGALKKRQGGSAGRWKTPHHQKNQAQAIEVGKALDVGDHGFWVTYARGMKFKAMREMQTLVEEYGESMYGIKRSSFTGEEKKEEEDESEDIEASIKAELEGLKEKKPAERKPFSIMPAEVECLLFVKTPSEIDPVEMVRRICKDARDCRNVMQRKVKYINRLSPVVSMEKATENGLMKVARRVMGAHFALVQKESSKDDPQRQDQEQKVVDRDVKGAGNESKPAEPEASHAIVPSIKASEAPMEGVPTYALRPTIRHHQSLKRDFVINQLAKLVRSEHKVNLGSPDKVVLIEVYQMFCGMSVVDGSEWENLRRYNMNELYRLGTEQQSKEKGKDEGSAEEGAKAPA